MKYLITLLTLLTLFAIAGCNLPGLSSPITPPISQPTPSSLPAAQVSPEAEVTEVSSEYPDTAEGVVSAFLDAYSQDNESMLEFLSPFALASLPEAGPAALLNFDGHLQGFFIQSATVVPEPPAALVEVIVDVDGKTGAREFQLSQSVGRWVIDTVIDPDQ